MQVVTLEKVQSAAGTISEIVQELQALPYSVDTAEAEMAFVVVGTYLAELSIALAANSGVSDALNRMIAGDTPVM